MAGVVAAFAGVVVAGIVGADADGGVVLDEVAVFVEVGCCEEVDAAVGEGEVEEVERRDGVEDVLDCIVGEGEEAHGGRW